MSNAASAAATSFPPASLLTRVLLGATTHDLAPAGARKVRKVQKNTATASENIDDMSRLRPRSAELEGYAYVPRMLDKARATLAGTPGDYPFGCPLDHTCMARLGITPELVLELVADHEDDAAVLARLREIGIPPAADVWFDAE